MRVLLLLLILFSSLPSFAGGVDDDSFGTRGGGNASVADFYLDSGYTLNRLLPSSPIELNGGVTVDVAKLIEVLRETNIEVTDKPLKIGDKVVDAINWPDRKLIQLNAKTWSAIPDVRKRQLMLHELLGLARIPDKLYEVSGQLLKISLDVIDNNTAYSCWERRTINGKKATAMIAALRNARGLNNKSADIQIPILRCSILQLQSDILTCSTGKFVFSDYDTNQIYSAMRQMNITAALLEERVRWDYVVKNLYCTDSADRGFQGASCTMDAIFNAGCAAH